MIINNFYNMKKVIVFLLILSFIFWLRFSYAAKVWVFATVWSINQSPIFIDVNPNSDPKLLKTWTKQTYSITISDKEKDNISYTITADNWFLNLSSWTISSWSYSIDKWYAYINFSYLAPTNIPSWNFTSIYITLNDWYNVVVKKLNLYIY